MFLPDPCDVPLCSCLDAKDLVNYSQACKDTRRSAAAYGRMAFQIRHSLSTFMAEKDVRPFRDVMRRTGTVITGSVAIHFFARTPVDDDDLNLVIEWKHSKDLFSFIQSLGYVYVPRPTQEKSTVSAVNYAYLRYTHRDQYLGALPNTVLDVLPFARGTTFIRVMIANFSAMDTILSFHSTPTMNAITFRAAYSLYPCNTFTRSVGVCFRQNLHVDMYKRRGWTMEGSASERTRAQHGEEVNAPIRFVGDANTWTIDLDDRPSLFLDTFMYNSWELRWTGRCNGWIMPRIESASYIGDDWWLQNRTFADCDLLGAFMRKLMDNQPRFVRQTDEDVLKSVLDSAKEMLFVYRPPCATDTLFLPGWDPEEESQATEQNSATPSAAPAAADGVFAHKVFHAGSNSPRASKALDDDIVRDALNNLTLGASVLSDPDLVSGLTSDNIVVEPEHTHDDGLAPAKVPSDAGDFDQDSVGARSDDSCSINDIGVSFVDGRDHSAAHSGDDASPDYDVEYASERDDLLFDSDDTQSSWSAFSLSNDQPPLKRMRTQ
ncbi:uncharacterized protein SCHCODRAFT_0106346 [Schizophyllum commune H4-8]